MILVIIILIVISVLAYSYYQTVRGENDLYKLNSSRPKLSRFQYVEILTNKGFNKDNIEIVYDEIYNFIGFDDFSMYPEDSIHEIYGIDDFDDIELIDNICEKLKIRKPTQEDYDNLEKEYSHLNGETILVLLQNLEK